FADHHEIVFQELEPLFVKLTEDWAGKKLKENPFPRIPFQDAMDRYGSDRPDLRYGMELVDLTEELRDTKFAVFSSAISGGGSVKAIRCVGGAKLTRSQIDNYTELTKAAGAGGLAYLTLLGTEAKSPIT